MALVSVVRKSQLEGRQRIDAEYYRPEYLNLEMVLSALNPVPLGRLAKCIRSFGAYSLTNKIIYRLKGIPFLRGIDVKPGYIDFSNVIYIDQDAHALLWKSNVEPGQVLLAMSGSVGNAAAADFRWSYPINSSQDLAKITPKDNLDPYFTATFLNSKYGRFQTKRLPVGSIQQHIFLWQIGMILVPLFESIQEEVSKIAREAQSKLAISERKYEEAENLLLSDLGLLDWKPAYTMTYIRKYSDIIKARRSDAEHFQPKYEQLLSLIKQFHPLRLSTLARSVFDITQVDPNKTYRYIEISDVNTSSGEVCFTDRAGKDLPPNAKIKVQGGELIISKVRPTRGAIGIVPVECSQDSVCSSAFSVYDVTSPMREFIQVVLRSPVGKTQLERPSRGTSYPTIDDSDVREILIPTVDQNNVDMISSLIQQAHAARHEAKFLLEKAKRAVEIAIEQGEEKAEKWLNEEGTMPVAQSIWKVDKNPTKLSLSSLKKENELEEMICQDISILNEQWLLIGRQVATAHGGIIDILAIDESGNLIVVELKKNKTPREVVTQAIDYASWVKKLDSTKIADIYKKYGKSINEAYESLDEALKYKFNKSFGEDEINNAHQVVVVASELDLSTERIIKYLNEYEIPINTMFFNVFRDGESRYLSRAWLIDPAETQEHANLAKAGDTEPWNGEYYVSFGHNMGRSWEDAREYGFISAGGGRWYSKTLNQLSKGDRIWVNIPQTGYIGVGIVEEPAVMAKDFMVKTEKGEVPILKVPLKATYLKQYAADEEKSEYFVKVKWLRSFSIKQAVSGLGFFGNQNSVCKPRSSKWLFTVDTLKKKWDVD